MPTPDLPTTEAEVWARIGAMRTVCWPKPLTEQIVFNRRVKREFQAARVVLKQDPVTAYATAVRAAERRDRVSHS